MHSMKVSHYNPEKLTYALETPRAGIAAAEAPPGAAQAAGPAAASTSPGFANELKGTKRKMEPPQEVELIPRARQKGDLFRLLNSLKRKPKETPAEPQHARDVPKIVMPVPKIVMQQNLRPKQPNSAPPSYLLSGVGRNFGQATVSNDEI